ncbi:hypothetical protein QBC38DRAFT_511387 [Podospora fimiseda]|uniref:Biogenesis of lysosome-related organelles complex 1 subunit KXD1 n=1 Tax=Podospora fimiseda TaxID=252190 RepID=A0AAN7BKM6_9PEZI|nr:hypothetical protein QBC38DRAFT_511387 [Podospora fimiseda]
MPIIPYTQYHNPYASYESNYSISPPEETLDSSTTSDSSGLAGSYSVSQTDSSSNNIMGGNGGMSGIDLNDYMSERFRDGVDLTGMDRIVVRQAQTSGHLNAKHRELLELQAKAQARLAKTRARFAQGLEDAREVRGDLEWTQKKVASLQAKAAKKHSREYTKARARYPSPPTF